MLNALVQLCTLANGLMVNFLAPAVYGLSAYGEFIALNATVFLVHRSVTILSEPLIRFTSAKLVLINSLVLNSLVFLVFSLVNRWVPLGSSLLLAGMLLSASVLLSMQALKLRQAYIALLATVCVSFMGLMGWSLLQPQPLPLVRLLELSTGIPALGGFIYLFLTGVTIPTGRALVRTLREVLRHVPQLLSITAVMNLLTSALPVFLVRNLVPYDLGLFKVMSSVIQSATSLFPVSTQALLTSFVQHTRGAEFYGLLRGMATLYFAAAGAGLILLAWVVPAVVPYVTLVACLPVFYQCVLGERHLTAMHRIRPLVAINLAIVALLILGLQWVQSVQHAALLYTLGFVVYAVALNLTQRTQAAHIPTLIVMAAAPFTVYLMADSLWFGFFYCVLVAAVELLQHVPTRADLRVLWNEL